MWTVRELKREQVCVGLQVRKFKLNNTQYDGVVSYVRTDENGHQEIGIQWEGDPKPLTQIEVGKNDTFVDCTYEVVGWLR